MFINVKDIVQYEIYIYERSTMSINYKKINERLETNFTNAFSLLNERTISYRIMATWGYIRVSTRDQNEERQIKEILPLVTTESHLIIEKKSGKDFDRPKWKALKDIMREGDTLVIKSLDRLGRNYYLIKQEWLELSKRKIVVHIIDTPLLNTDRFNDSLMGEFAVNLVFEVLSFVAENERRTTHQRQVEGIAIAKNNGVKFGRPTTKYPSNWKQIYKEWKEEKITAVNAMNILGLKKTTFYKLVKEYEKDL